MGTRTLVFDVETTGLFSYDRVISIAGLWCDGLEVLPEHFYLVFNPGKKCHPEATKAHGLQDWWLRFQPPFEKHASDLRKLFDRAGLIVGHNIGFDIRMLNHEFEKAGNQPIQTDAFCTMQAFRDCSPGCSAKLDDCLSSIGLRRTSDCHNAFEDTFLTANLYCWIHGVKNSLPLPSPLPLPSNQVSPPQQVIWADLVDRTPANGECLPPPECVIAALSRFGIEVVGQSARTIRMLLAGYEYATMLAQRTPEDETDEQLRDLVYALADSPDFKERLRMWSRWAWGRPNPQLKRDEMRAYAEEVLSY